MRPFRERLLELDRRLDAHRAAVEAHGAALAGLRVLLEDTRALAGAPLSLAPRRAPEPEPEPEPGPEPEPEPEPAAPEPAAPEPAAPVAPPDAPPRSPPRRA